MTDFDHRYRLAQGQDCPDHHVCMLDEHAELYQARPWAQFCLAIILLPILLLVAGLAWAREMVWKVRGM